MAKIRTTYGVDVISGKVGAAVFSNDQDGVGMREYNPISHQPFSPAQLAAEAAFTKANQTWTTLPAATVAQWRTYAATQKVRNSLTGKYRTRTAKNVFVGLYAKLLQVSATHALPTVPTGSYAGDPITLTAAATTGEIVFTPSAANSAGTRTELLIQRLPSPNAIPTEQYETAAIEALEDEFSVSVSPGTWACAYRFVNVSTGQQTAMVTLTPVSVALSLQTGGAADAAPVSKRKAA